jgi:hypothetical protein
MKRDEGAFPPRLAWKRGTSSARRAHAFILKCELPKNNEPCPWSVVSRQWPSAEGGPAGVCYNSQLTTDN